MSSSPSKVVEGVTFSKIYDLLLKNVIFLKVLNKRSYNKKIYHDLFADIQWVCATVQRCRVELGLSNWNDMIAKSLFGHV